MPARIKKNHRTQKSAAYGKKSRPVSPEMGSFRIIGGEWRSRRLSFPAIEGLRPTTDRVKETVFNWLVPYLPGASVLDLFAGSGSLGLEALSRGAGSLVSIEMDARAIASLASNYELLKVPKESVELVCANALNWLASHEGEAEQFDLVFLDPPFRKGLLDETISLLRDQSLLKDGALIYLEREQEGLAPSLPSDWHLMKEKVAGQVCYQLYQRQAKGLS